MPKNSHYTVSDQDSEINDFSKKKFVALDQQPTLDADWKRVTVLVE